MSISQKHSFKGGLHVNDNKALSGEKIIETMPPVKQVYISLSQHIGKPAKAVVEVGDLVKKGQLVGQETGFISANIYSSVSGKVVDIKEIKTHVGTATYVIIENDFREDEVFLEDIDETDGSKIIERIREAGLVGLGGAGFPTTVKITPKEEIDVIVINGAECEPYLTCDYRVMLEYTEQLYKGFKFLSKALKGSKIVVGIEENKPLAIEKLGALDGIEVVPLKKKYPQGSEKQLIYACTGRRVAPGKLPSSVGVCVFNVQTAFQVYEAVANNRALFQRVITVTGKGVKEPKNLLVKNGTPYEDIIAYCGGLKDGARKIIVGGPMMGKALTALYGYARKTDSGLLVLDKSEVNEVSPSACINCGRCAKSCPMSLMPMYIDLFTHTGDYEKADLYGASNCFECGVCAYVCPAKRDLVGSVQLCKAKLREMKS